MSKLLAGLLAVLLALAGLPAFANTLTTNYSLNKPSVGADSNTWGNLSNSNWDSLDSIVFGVQGTANAACPKAGCTFTGNVTVPGLTATGKINWAAAMAAFASANCPNGTAPTTPATGDLWCVGGKPFYYDGAATHTIAFLDSSITGNAATATSATTATKLATARSIATSGDIACTTTNFDGSQNITLPNCNLPATGGGFNGGDGTHTVTLNIDTKGRVINANTNAINLASLIGGSLSGNGYIAIPAAGTGTLYIEWGVYDSGSDTGWNGSQVNVTFPHAFSSTLLSVTAVAYNSGFSAGAKVVQFVGAPNNVNAAFTGALSSGNIRGFFWMAIGE